MAHGMLSDADIRSALMTKLRSREATEPDAAIIEELGVCQGRARLDIAVVNGSLHGFEIKSDRDSLRRLPGQAETYSKVLDRMTLVLTERHARAGMPQVPAWWRVLLATQVSAGIRFKVLRRGAQNRMRDARALVELLWLDESLALLERRKIARGVRGKSRRVVWDRVCAQLSLEEVALAVREHLKARTANGDFRSPTLSDG